MIRLSDERLRECADDMFYALSDNKSMEYLNALITEQIELIAKEADTRCKEAESKRENHDNSNYHLGLEIQWNFYNGARSALMDFAAHLRQLNKN